MHTTSATAATLADFIRPELIIPQLAGRSMSSVMQELTDVLHRQDSNMPTQLSSSLAAVNRELLTGTALDLGAAFPQVRVATVSRPFFALGRAREPLPWRARFLPQIEFVFLVVEPTRAELECEQLVRTLNGLGTNRLRLDDLRRARTAEELLAMLAQIPLVATSKLARVPDATAAPHNSPARIVFSFRRWRRV